MSAALCDRITTLDPCPARGQHVAHAQTSAVLCCAVRSAVLQDIVLFDSILSDLFPNTQLPEADSQQLSDALAAACWECGLQPQQAFLGKAMQLHDTLGVRFGVMLVGPAGGCRALGAPAVRLSTTSCRRTHSVPAAVGLKRGRILACIKSLLCPRAAPPCMQTGWSTWLWVAHCRWRQDSLLSQPAGGADLHHAGCPTGHWQEVRGCRSSKHGR